MTRYTVTPWRKQADLMEVRHQLYASTTEDRALQRHAVNRVMAWKLRGNLPHAVESTALLVDAILHHDLHVNSTFSIRAVYSAAFCRFVTGFCDIGRHRERALEPSSMLAIAKQIDMPAEFVALRHEATHEELPGLQRLMNATQRALDWLWRVYWSRIDFAEDAKDAERERVALKNEVAPILRGYRKVVRDGLLAKKQTSDEREAHARQTCEAFTATCQDSQRLTIVLAELMVDDGYLLPAARGLRSSMDGSYLLWDTLIVELQRYLRTDFTHTLGLALLGGLTKPSTRKPGSDPDKDALAQWLLHLITSLEAGENRDQCQLSAEVMKQCCLYPGYWTHKIGTELLAISDDAFRKAWGELFHAGLDADGTDDLEPGAIDLQMDVENSNHVSTEDAEKGTRSMEVERIDTWSRAILPPLVPIGMVK